MTYTKIPLQNNFCRGIFISIQNSYRQISHTSVRCVFHHAIFSLEMITLLKMPVSKPLTVPASNNTGKYQINLEVFISMAAQHIWPILCAAPPAILTPTGEKHRNLFSKSITKRLQTMPAALYANTITLPNSSVARPTRTAPVIHTVGTSIRYKANRVTI